MVSIDTIISCSTLAESLLEALLGAMVQTYSLLHHDLPRKQEGALRVSVLMSVLSLVKGFAELDDKGKILRAVSTNPFIPITGSAAKSDPAFVAVGCYRAVAVVGRLLLVPFFQVLTHHALKLPVGIHLGAAKAWQPAVGAPLLVTLDFVVQAVLIYRYTTNRAKLGWALASVISPTEPILHSGCQPIFTTKPWVAAGVHAAEALAAACAVIFTHGGVSATTTFLQDSLNMTDCILLAVCVCCCLLQLPMLLLVQHFFAYRVEPWETWGEACHLGPSPAHLDTADLAAPLHMILSAISTDKNRDTQPEITPISVAEELALLLKTSENEFLRAEYLDAHSIVPAARTPTEVLSSTASEHLWPPPIVFAALQQTLFFQTTMLSFQFTTTTPHARSQPEDSS